MGEEEEATKEKLGVSILLREGEEGRTAEEGESDEELRGHRGDFGASLGEGGVDGVELRTGPAEEGRGAKERTLGERGEAPRGIEGEEEEDGRGEELVDWRRLRTGVLFLVRDFFFFFFFFKKKKQLFWELEKKYS